MRTIFVLITLLIYCNAGLSQKNKVDSIQIHQWAELKKYNPDTIYGLSFSKMKLKELPDQLKAFENLQILDLSKNELETLPEWLGSFSALKVLNVSKNKLIAFPLAICRLTELEKLMLNRNYFDRLPECIGFCEKLIFIDLWSTPVMYFPESIIKLKSLREIDLQGVKYSPSFQEKLKEKLPQTKILFDPPCDCMK